MIVISKSRNEGLYYVNKKPLLLTNLDFHKKGSNRFTTEELKAFENYIEAIN